jgi:hypothetical protein
MTIQVAAIVARVPESLTKSQEPPLGSCPHSPTGAGSAEKAFCSLIMCCYGFKNCPSLLHYEQG